MSSIELLQLQYFECIAKNQSVTKAAEELRISQPSLSGSLLRLEKELGAPLFERKNRKMILTSYGEYFLSTTRKVLELINISRLSFSSEMPARISVAFENYNEHFFSLLENFQKKYPQIEFNVYGSTLNTSFAVGAFTFIIGNSETILPFPVNKRIIEDRSYFVAVPVWHRLADRSSLSITELKDEPFCFLRTSKGDFEHAYQFCIESGFIPRCIFSTNNAFFKYRYIMNGSALGIFPTGWHTALSKSENIRMIPLEEFDRHATTILFWPRDVKLSSAENAFLEYVLEELPES